MKKHHPVMPVFTLAGAICATCGEPVARYSRTFKVRGQKRVRPMGFKHTQSEIRGANRDRGALTVGDLAAMVDDSEAKTTHFDNMRRRP